MVVSSAAMRHSPAARNACKAMALSFPPLQQNSTSCVTRSSLMARRVFHANAKLAAERGIAECVLILFVGEIHNAPEKTDAVSQLVRTRKIKTRVARIAGQSQPQEITIAAAAREIPGEIPVHAPECRVQLEISGMDRASNQAAAYNVIRIEIVGGGEHAC